MEREELLQQVTESIEADGKQLSPSISEESINGELDDALEDLTDDEENNKKVVARLAKRLLRIDGNIHSNVSREVKAYKNAHPKNANGNGNGNGNGEEDKGGTENKTLEALMARLDAMEAAQKTKAERDAKDSITANVKRGLKAKFKDAGLDVNEYIMKQTLRDLEIPEMDEDEHIDEDELIGKMERAYFKNLKAAGLGKEDTGKARFGSRGGGKGESAADRFFAKKAKKEGWKK